jgi:hypothetical protein
MKKNIIILFIIAAAIAVYYYATRKTLTTLQGPAISTTNGKSINNPGNIETNGKVLFDGQILSPSPVYGSFATMAYGYAAIYATLVGYGSTSLYQAYATYSGNPAPASQVNYICQFTGTDGTEDISTNLADPTYAMNVITGIAKIEQGANFAINFNDISTGLTLT